MSEIWHKWEPIEGLTKDYFVYEVRARVNGFSILLAEIDDHSKGLLIDFGYSMESYRSTEEGLRLKTIASWHEMDFAWRWPSFKVENSEYLQWLSQESGTLSDSYKLQHFAFVTPDEILDVIAGRDPKAKFVVNVCDDTETRDSEDD